MELNDIIEACKKEDKKAQYLLYKDLFSELMRVSMRYCKNRDDAVALVNDGFLKIMIHLNSYTPTNTFISWAKRIMVNTAIDKYRSDKTYREQTAFYENDSQFEQDIHSTQDIDPDVDLEQIYRCLDQLPIIEKDVFNLYSIDGYSHQEIGELLKISERSSKRHLANARLKLQQMLQKAMYAILISFWILFKLTL